MTRRIEKAGGGRRKRREKRRKEEHTCCDPHIRGRQGGEAAQPVAETHTLSPSTSLIEC